MSDEELKAMVDAFLAWPLPNDVAADVIACQPGAPHRTGTNLLTAAQARKMFEHCLAAIARGEGMSEWISNADNRLSRSPCDPDIRVDLVLRNGETRRGLAGDWGVCWRDDGTDYDIVMYRVIEPADDAGEER